MLRLAKALTLLLTLITVLPACDEDKVQSEARDVTPGVGFISMDATPLRGALPMEVEVVLQVTTRDPLADLLISVDFDDGEVDEEISSTTLGEDASEEQLGEPETRTLTFTHTYTERGNYKIRATAVDLTNSTDESAIEALPISIDVIAENLPDLIAVEVFTPTEVIDFDQPFEIAYQVLNNGSSVLTDSGEPRPFNVLIYLVDSPDATLDSLSDPDRAIQLTRRSVQGGLANQAAFNETVNVRLPDDSATRQRLSTGTWYPAIWVDPDNEALPILNITEQDEENNFTVAPSGISSPDLANITGSIQLGNQLNVSRLNEIRLDLTLTNDGTAATEAFDYVLYLSSGDSELGLDDLRLGAGTQVGGLDAGESVTISGLRFPLDTELIDPQEVWIIASLDTEDLIPESDDEDNTFAAEPINVEGIIQRNIDIIASSVTTDLTQTYIGGQLQIGFTVTNRGDDPSGEFSCQIFLSDNDSLDVEVDTFQAQERDINLVPGTSRTLERTIVVDAPAAGDYVMFVTCDPLDEVTETDETNNEAGPSPTITIAESADLDFTLQNLSVDASSLADGETFSATIDVCNQGGDAAIPPPTVKVYLSLDDTLDGSDIEIVNASLLSLFSQIDASACESVELSGTVSCIDFVDSYTLIAAVDPDDNDAESNEDNNILTGGAFTVTDSSTSTCSCTEDASEGSTDNNDASRAFPITLTSGSASLSDQGLCDPVDFYAVDLAFGESIEVSLSGASDAANNDLDLRLYDPTHLSEPLLADDLGSAESLSHIARQSDTTVIIEVFPKAPGGRNQYTLDVTVAPSPDKAELTPTAFTFDSLTPDTTRPFAFSATLLNNGKAEATDVVLDLYLSADTTLDTTSDVFIDSITTPSLTPFAEVVVPVEYTFADTIESGTYHIIASVDPADAVDEADENNNVLASAALTIDTTCTVDALEGALGNDSFADAALITPDTGAFFVVPGLSVCDGGRDDFYRVCAASTDTFNHVAAHQPNVSSSTALSITLYDRDQTLIGSDDSSSAEIISVPVPDFSCAADTDCATGETCQAGSCADADGLHCVLAHVELRSSASASTARYELFIDNVAPDQRFEPNEDKSAAVTRTQTIETLAANSSGGAASDDEDWYALELPAGASFELLLETADSNLRARIDLSVCCDRTASPMDPQSITVSASQSGPIYFRVYSTGAPSTAQDRTSAYSLHLVGLDGIDLTPVNLTADLDKATAGDVLILSWGLENTRLTPTDGDVSYRYWLSEDATADPITDIPLRIAGQPLPGTSRTVTGPGTLEVIDIVDKVYLDIPRDIFGNYRILVEVDYENQIPDEDSEENNADNTFITLLHDCLPDSLEDNDTFSTPTAISLDYSSVTDLSGETLSLCSADPDYYSFSVPNNATVDAVVNAMVLHDTGDLDIYLYTSTGTELGRSDQLNTSSESISWTNDTGAPADLVLQIIPFGERAGISNIYDLSVTLR